jgi:hypothetical protein
MKRIAFFAVAAFVLIDVIDVPIGSTAPAQEFEVCRCLAGHGRRNDPDPSTLYYSSVFRKQSDRDDYDFVNYVMKNYRHGNAEYLAPPRCQEFSTASDGDDWKTQDMKENDVFVIVDTRWRP